MFLSLYDVKVSLMVQTFKSIKDDALKTRNQISVLLSATPLRADPWSVRILCSEGIVTASIERLSSDRERKTCQRQAQSSPALLHSIQMVGRVGLEPTTSRLSGVRSNHLSYRPYSKWCLRHRPLRACPWQVWSDTHRAGTQPGKARRGAYCGTAATKTGGAYRDRTDDPLLAKQMLSQLS